MEIVLRHIKGSMYGTAAPFNKSKQGAVNLEFVLNYIKGSISCTATPFNESSVIIIWHQLAKSADNLLVCFPF